jgi:hypothetical protein
MMELLMLAPEMRELRRGQREAGLRDLMLVLWLAEWAEQRLLLAFGENRLSGQPCRCALCLQNARRRT